MHFKVPAEFYFDFSSLKKAIKQRIENTWEKDVRLISGAFHILF